MKFRATDEQMAQICANAVNVSLPAGMGWIHYDPTHHFTPEFFLEPRHFYLDYIEGRMVKLWVREEGEGVWSFPDEDPTPDYQSWCDRYLTWKDLALSVPGVEVL